MLFGVMKKLLIKYYWIIFIPLFFIPEQLSSCYYILKSVFRRGLYKPHFSGVINNVFLALQRPLPSVQLSYRSL